MAWSAGVCLLPLRFRDHLEAFVFRMAFGLGALGTIFFGFGLLGILTRAAVLIAATASVAGALALRRRWERPPIEIVPVVLGGAVLFVLTLYPPTSWDDTMYHLPYAKTFAETGGVPLIPSLRFPIFPQIQEMLYAAALLVGNDLAAQGLHLLAALLLALAILSFARRFVADLGAGAVAAAAVLGSPLIIRIGTAAFVDVGLTLFAQLSMHALENWRRERERGWLIAACAFAAFAAATKYFGLFFVIAIPAMALATGGRKALRHVGAGIAVALLLAGPWYARIYLETGFPLHPLFLGQTPTSEVAAGSPHLVQTPVEFVEQRVSMFRDRLPQLWRVPLDAVRHPTRFGQAPPLTEIFVLLLPLAVVWFAISRTSRPWMIAPLAYSAVWLLALKDRRFLLPAMPLLAIAGACALLYAIRRRPARDMVEGGADSVRREPGARDAAGIAIVAILVVASLLPGALYIRSTLQWRGPIPLDTTARDRYITRAYPFYPALKFLNETAGRNYTVFALFCEHGQYYAEGTFWGDWIGRGAYRQIVSGTRFREPRRILDVLNGLGAQYLLLDRHRENVEVPADREFRAHFRPIFGRARLLVYEKSDRPLRWTETATPLRDGTFDRLEAWSRHLDCARAAGAVRCGGDANLRQGVAVRPGIYELSLRTRSDQRDARSRLQVNWAAADGAFLGTDIDVVPAETTWRSASMIVSVPERAATAEIYVQSHDGTVAWFDDVTFRRIDYVRPESNER